MKSKTKLDPKVVQQFFIDHAEKFVIGLVGVVFLLLGWQSVTVALDKYKKTPDELKQATTLAMNKITSGPATKKADSEEHYVQYAEQIDKFKSPIEAAEYPMPARMYWRPIGPLKLRDAPKVFPVEHLRAIAGRGAIFQVNANAGGGGAANTVGKRWVLVTGLVPYKQQVAEYHNVFDGSALETPNDTPTYLGFLYQRAEVVPGEKEKDLKWSDFVIPVSSSKAAIAAKWGGRMGSEVADDRFVHPLLTSPLPALAGATWGIEAVSPPQIPVTERKAEETAPQGGGTGGHTVPMAGKPPVRVGPPIGGMVTNPQGGQTADAGGIFDKPDEKVAVGKATEKENEAEVPDYKLLRFFDFDVKPNTAYRYRVFLILENPNHDLPANVLEEQELAVQPYLGLKGKLPTKTADGLIWETNSAYGEWSKDVVSDQMSGGLRLLCGKVTAANTRDETKADIRILLWLQKSGRNGSCTKENLIRGTVLNFPEAAFKVPGSAQPTMLHPFNLNSILVDIQGGDPPTPSQKDKTHATPGMILVVDENGNLVMHDELAESKEWDDATKALEAEKPQELHGRGGQGGGPTIRRPPDNGGGAIINELDPGHVRHGAGH